MSTPDVHPSYISYIFLPVWVFTFGLMLRTTYFYSFLLLFASGTLLCYLHFVCLGWSFLALIWHIFHYFFEKRPPFVEVTVPVDSVISHYHPPWKKKDFNSEYIIQQVDPLSDDLTKRKDFVLFSVKFFIMWDLVTIGLLLTHISLAYIKYLADFEGIHIFTFFYFRHWWGIMLPLWSACGLLYARITGVAPFVANFWQRKTVEKKMETDTYSHADSQIDYILSILEQWGLVTIAIFGAWWALRTEDLAFLEGSYFQRVLEMVAVDVTTCETSVAGFLPFVRLIFSLLAAGGVLACGMNSPLQGTYDAAAGVLLYLFLLFIFFLHVLFLLRTFVFSWVIFGIIPLWILGAAIADGPHSYSSSTIWYQVKNYCFDLEQQRIKKKQKEDRKKMQQLQNAKTSNPLLNPQNPKKKFVNCPVCQKQLVVIGSTDPNMVVDRHLQNNCQRQ